MVLEGSRLRLGSRCTLGYQSTVSYHPPLSGGVRLGYVNSGLSTPPACTAHCCCWDLFHQVLALEAAVGAGHSACLVKAQKRLSGSRVVYGDELNPTHNLSVYRNDMLVWVLVVLPLAAGSFNNDWL